MKDLTKLNPVAPDQGKAQWVEGKATGIAKDEAERTHLMGIPPLMPCTIIFVHGVNSDGEWYEEAMKQFCRGLNQRLGRSDLRPAEYVKAQRRFSPRDDNGRLNSPIVPFYWGYKVPRRNRIKLVDSTRTADRPDAWADRFGNPLRNDGSWGGGPFQNGTHSLLQFWQSGFLRLRSWAARSLTLVAVPLLTACSLGGIGGPYPGVPALSDAGRTQPYTGEVAAPQVAYRIDENRYFEIVPNGPGACTNAMVHFVDKAKGIRSEAVLLDRGPMLRATLIIDASNDQYLVAPVTRGNTDCSSGGGLCGGAKLPYSTDGGRTWKRAEAFSPSDDLLLQASLVYASHDERRARSLGLEKKFPILTDWTPLEKSEVPTAKKNPLDTKFHCTVNGKE